MRLPNAHWRQATQTVNRLGLALLLGGIALPRAASAADAPGAVGASLIEDSGLTVRPGDEELYLEATLNGTPTGHIVHVLQRDGELYAGVATLRALGFIVDPRQGQDPVRLRSLPGVQVAYDDATQRITITAPLQLLRLDRQQLNQPEQVAPKASASPGVLLNYDIYGSRGGGLGNLSALAELRAFSGGAGVLSNTSLLRRYQTQDGWQGRSVRLDTSWQLSFPEQALTLVAGDTTTGALAWTRATRIGGIALSRNFALQPYEITTPLPAFFGEATVPSAVDLYVNGMRQYSGQVPAGPFQIAAVPGISGAGNAQIVVTDALGRSSTIAFPFYATQQLLRKGLYDGSLALGVVRQDYGLRSFSYAHRPVASGSLRYGASDAFTIEGHAESGAGVQNAGLGGAWLLGTAGVLNGSLARSNHGWQYGAGYSWNGRRFNFSLDSLRTRGRYLDVASRYGLAPARVNERAFAGINTARGNIGVNFIRLRYPGETEARYGGVFWTQTLYDYTTLNLSVNQNLLHGADRSIFLGVAILLDARTTLNVNLARDRDRYSATVDVTRPVPGDGGFGWRAQGRAGPGTGGGLAEAGWLGNAAQLTGGVSRLGDSSYGYADATGSLVWIGGHVFAARHIDDAFALVSTDGVAGVPVKLENRDIGTTDDRGMLLVSRLNAYQRNKVAIDPMQLPADMQLDRVETFATPSDRAGVIVDFGLREVRSASLLLVDAAGQPLPLGSRVRVAGQPGVDLIIGRDGLTYLENLAPHNELQIDTASGTCTVRFDAPPDTGTIPQIGPLTCRKESP